METIADIIESFGEGKSQSELARLLDIPTSTFNDWMRRITTPRDRDIKAIVQHIGLPKAYLAVGLNIPTCQERTAAADAMAIAYHERLWRRDSCTKEQYLRNTSRERNRMTAALVWLKEQKNA